MELLEYFQNYYILQNYGPGYVATNVTYVVAVVLLLNDTPWRDWRGMLRKLGEIFLCWLGTVAFCSVYSVLFGHSYMDRLMMLLFLLFYAGVCSKYSVKTRVVRSAVFFTCTLTALPVSEPIGRALELATSEDYTWVEHLTSVIIVAMTVLVVWFMRRFSTEHQAFAPVFPLVLVVIVSALGLVLLIDSELMGIDDDYKFFHILLASCFWLLELGSYYLYYRLTEEYNKNLELVAIQQKEDLEQELLQFSQHNYEEMHMIRHEMKNNMLYIRSLAERQEYQRLLAYLDKASKDTEGLFEFVECGNDVINAVMNHALKQAQRYDVLLSHQIVAPPGLPYEEMDLCSLLSNLLDNAIEATAESGAEDPRVTVSIRPMQDYLFIRVTNPVNHEVSERRRLSLRTIKKNASAHGYGTKIIGRIALKYRGSVKFSMEDDHFVADVMLSLMEEEQDGKAVSGDL